MDRFFSQQNLTRYKKLAFNATNAEERKLLFTLLAAEETNFIEQQNNQIKRSLGNPRWRSWSAHASSAKHATAAFRALPLIHIDDYGPLKSVIPGLPGTYDIWLYEQGKVEAGLISQNIPIQRFEIVPSEFVRYCTAAQRDYCPATLYLFVDAKAAGENF